MGTTKIITWKEERRPVDSLKEWADNPVKHDKDKSKDLEESIIKFGLARPLVIQPDGTIIGGHGTKAVLMRLKVAVASCYVPDRKLNKAEFKELNVRLNKNLSGTFDVEKLNQLFEPEELYGIGFSEKEINISAPIDLGAAKSEALLKGGDVVEIGKHRLVVKEAKALKTIVDLMEKEKAITFIGGGDICENIIKAALQARPDAVITINGTLYKAD